MKGTLSFLSVLVVALIVVNGLFVFKHFGKDEAPVSRAQEPLVDAAQAYILPISGPSYFPILDSNVPRPKIDARSALIYDARSARLLYNENSQAKVPIASLTKILTAVVVLENFDQSDVFTVPAETVKVDGVKQDLYAGENLTVDQLLKIMLVGSSNDAAVALAAYAQSKQIDLVVKMNEKAHALGMADSQFLDPAGLMDQAHSNPQDLLKLVRYGLKYESIWNTLVEKEIEIPSVDGKFVHRVKNTDQLLGVIPNIVGGKTGFTDGALGCLILIVNLPEQHDTIISIVLGSHDRFGDTQKMIDWIKQAYRWE